MTQGSYDGMLSTLIQEARGTMGPHERVSYQALGLGRLLREMPYKLSSGG